MYIVLVLVFVEHVFEKKESFQSEQKYSIYLYGLRDNACIIAINTIHYYQYYYQHRFNHILKLHFEKSKT